jgi:flagellar export protein FliJ
MSKYRFRLATLEKMRIAHRDQLRAALAEAYSAERVLSERREEFVAEVAALRDLQRNALATPTMDVNQLVEAQRYATVLQAQDRMLKDQSAKLAVEIERRRLAVVEADRAVKVLEKLDENRRAEHRKNEDRREAKQLDEIATLRRPKT